MLSFTAEEAFFGLDCGFNHVYYVVCSKEKTITRTLLRHGLRLQMKKNPCLQNRHL